MNKKTIEDYRTVGKARGISFVNKHIPNSVRTSTDGWIGRCGHMWRARYDNIRSGYDCPHCAGNLPKTIEDYRTVGKARGISFVNRRIPNAVLIPTDGWICKEDHTWRASYNSIQSGYGCPTCKNKTEAEVGKYIHSFCRSFKPQQRLFKGEHKSKSVDLHSYDLNMTVEVQGEQHFGPVRFGGRSQEKSDKAFPKQVKRDRMVRKYHKDNGMFLYEIIRTNWEKDPKGEGLKLKQAIAARREQLSKPLTISQTVKQAISKALKENGLAA